MPYQRNQTTTPAPTDKVMAFILSGGTPKGAAMEFGVSEYTIFERLRKHGVSKVWLTQKEIKHIMGRRRNRNANPRRVKHERIGVLF